VFDELGVRNEHGMYHKLVHNFRQVRVLAGMQEDKWLAKDIFSKNVPLWWLTLTPKKTRLAMMDNFYNIAIK
jgi:hypothetical protein